MVEPHQNFVRVRADCVHDTTQGCKKSLPTVPSATKGNFTLGPALLMLPPLLLHLSSLNFFASLRSINGRSLPCTRTNSVRFYHDRDSWSDQTFKDRSALKFARLITSASSCKPGEIYGLLARTAQAKTTTAAFAGHHLGPQTHGAWCGYDVVEAPKGARQRRFLSTDTGSTPA